nr:hypothetical protein [Tanacetum cinerariifolium]
EQQTQVTREKTDEEFTEAGNNKERVDVQATNILSQGLPRHIFNTLNQTEMEKQIWENAKLLMQGSSLTKQQKKETMFDQYERQHNQPLRLHNMLFHHLKSVQQRAPGNKGKQVATGSQGNKQGSQEYRSMVNAQGKLVTCYNCRSQGHVARQCWEKKRAKDSQWFKDKALLMEAKEKGVVLDAEA